jgi:hypothetical protein
MVARPEILLRRALCALPALWLAGVVGCDAGPDGPEPAPSPFVDAGVPPTTPDAGSPAPSVTWDRYAPGPALAPRLTAAQLRNTWRDLAGEDIQLPPVALPDVAKAGLLAVGASQTTVSSRTAEDLERAALLVARQTVDPARRERWMPCEPSGVDDAACVRQGLERFGGRAWRRSLQARELDALTALAMDAAREFGDVWEGMTWSLAAILQSPHLLFRVERGEPDPDAQGQWRLTSEEMAVRLGYLLWNSTPDDALLEAGRNGELVTEAGLRAQVTRLLESPRAREGILEFFRQLYGLDALLRLTKDPMVFPSMSPLLGPAALEETERFLWSLVEEGADMHLMLLSDETFVDRRLAALYGIPTPSLEGFQRVTLPPWTGRRGFLGQASFLLMESHPTSTSVTLRGQFIRERLLCLPVPAPPADVDTAIPEPSSTARTMRERLAVHLENPTCASCHGLTDPIGLSFENFDGLGQWRETENGVEIDSSGEMDGVQFRDAWELADVIASQPEFASCMVQGWLRYARSAVEVRTQRVAIPLLTDTFAQGGFRFRDLIEATVLSPAFRTLADPATVVETDEEEETP